MTPSLEMLVRATKVFEEITLDLCDDDEIKKIIAEALQRVQDETVEKCAGIIGKHFAQQIVKGTKP